MKNPIRNLLLTAIALAFAVCLGCLATSASAQTADTPPAITNAAIDTAAAVAQPFIVNFAQSHPVILSILAVIATLRVVFKPIVSAAAAYVASTESTADDEFLDHVEHSKAYRIFAWLLDYLGSIKVGPQKATPAK